MQQPVGSATPTPGPGSVLSRAPPSHFLYLPLRRENVFSVLETERRKRGAWGPRGDGQERAGRGMFPAVNTGDPGTRPSLLLEAPLGPTAAPAFSAREAGDGTEQPPADLSPPPAPHVHSALPLPWSAVRRVSR